MLDLLFNNPQQDRFYAGFWRVALGALPCTLNIVANSLTPQKHAYLVLSTNKHLPLLCLEIRSKQVSLRVRIQYLRLQQQALLHFGSAKDEQFLDPWTRVKLLSKFLSFAFFRRCVSDGDVYRFAAAQTCVEVYSAMCSQVLTRDCNHYWLCLSYLFNASPALYGGCATAYTLSKVNVACYKHLTWILEVLFRSRCSRICTLGVIVWASIGMNS